MLAPQAVFVCGTVYMCVCVCVSMQLGWHAAVYIDRYTDIHARAAFAPSAEGSAGLYISLACCSPLFPR